MAQITVTCARTGKFVWTGLESEPNEFERLRPRISRFRCSACGSEHVWSPGIAWLTEVPSPAAPKTEKVDLLEEVTPTRVQPTRAARIVPDHGQRISAIIERLLR